MVTVIKEVAEALLDGKRVSALGDRQRGRGVPQLMEDQALELGTPEHAGAPVSVPSRSRRHSVLKLPRRIGVLLGVGNTSPEVLVPAPSSCAPRAAVRATPAR